MLYALGHHTEATAILPRVIRPTLCLTVAIFLGSAGCSVAREGPRVLTFSAGDYTAAFDAAVAVAKEHKLQPVVMDRETGVIETRPRHAGSLLEPWRRDNGTLGDTMAHTINFERRRLRIEFVPAEFSAPTPDPSKPVLAAAIPGSTRAEGRFDLLRNPSPVEMRAWVYVEREFVPNQSIGDWTYSQTRTSSDPLDTPDPRDATTTSPGDWTPVGRDEAYERTIVAEIQRLLQPPTDSAPAPKASIEPQGGVPSNRTG
jgi:hypothetical protein